MIQVVIFGFEEKVKAFLDSYAESNKNFAAKYITNPECKKTLSGCCKYVTDIIRKAITGMADAKYTNGNIGQVDDDVVYQMAIEYFADDSIVEKQPDKHAPKVDNPDKKKEAKNKPDKTETTIQPINTPVIAKKESTIAEKMRSTKREIVQLSLFN